MAMGSRSNFIENMERRARERAAAAPTTATTPAPAPAPASSPAPKSVAPPLPVDFGNGMYSPQVELDANGYPVNPGYMSVRGAGGGLAKQYAVEAPQLSDLSNWQGLKDQQTGLQNKMAMDTARKQSFASLPPQGEASLSSGARGIAALSALGGAQEGLTGATMAGTQRGLGVAQEALGKQFDLAKTQAGLGQAAQAANLQTQMKDIQNLNKWKTMQYNQELQKQQGIDMRNAIANAGKGGPSDLQKVWNRPLDYIPGATWNPLLDAGLNAVGLKDDFDRSSLNPKNWF